MGLVMNKSSNSCGYFDSFGRQFPWLEETLKKHFKTIHRTKHIIQSEASSTCGLHTIYFIIIMMDPLNKTALTKNVNVGEYVRHYYDTKNGNASIKDKHIVNHLAKKFHTHAFKK